jgi:hypothetical protein
MGQECARCPVTFHEAVALGDSEQSGNGGPVGCIRKRFNQFRAFEGGSYTCSTMSSTSENSQPVTKLEYVVSGMRAAPRAGDPLLQFQGAVKRTDYRFRVNVERLGVHPLTIKMRFEWGDGTCRLLIEAPASEDILRAALDPALRVVGLRADQISTSGG